MMGKKIKITLRDGDCCLNSFIVKDGDEIEKYTNYMQYVATDEYVPAGHMMARIYNANSMHRNGDIEMVRIADIMEFISDQQFQAAEKAGFPFLTPWGKNGKQNAYIIEAKTYDYGIVHEIVGFEKVAA